MAELQQVSRYRCTGSRTQTAQRRVAGMQWCWPDRLQVGISPLSRSPPRSMVIAVESRSATGSQ
eukprot:3311214-Amphidinium_carterae.1